MRHKLNHRKLNRTSEHRKALFKNMLNSLIKYEQITTTLPKAKFLKPQADKIITLVKKNSLQNHAASRLRCRAPAPAKSTWKMILCLRHQQRLHQRRRRKHQANVKIIGSSQRTNSTACLKRSSLCQWSW